MRFPRNPLLWPFFLAAKLIGLVIGTALGLLAKGLVLLLGGTWPSNTFTAMPYVIDGDTLAFDGDVRVRLHGLDAPEMDHPTGKASKDHLKALIGGRAVTVRIVAIDKYGRHVAKVFAPDGTDLCKAMVAHGYARAYTSFSRDYARDEAQAKKTRAGLWGQNVGLWGQNGMSLHPELWRKAQR